MYRRPATGSPQSTDYKESPGWTAWMFLGYVLFFYLQGGYRFPVLGQIRFELILGVVLGIAAIVIVAQQPRQPLAHSTGITGWMFAMLVIASLMTAITQAPVVSFDVYVDRVLKFMLMALFIRAFVDSPRRLRWFLFIYLLAFLKMAEEGILGLITGSLVWENQGTPRLHGATPNYTHPNSFSGTQLGTLPFLLSLLPVVVGRWKIAVALHALAAITIVITTGSRTGYVALLLWAGMAIWKAKSRMKTLGIVLLAVAIAIPMVPQDYFDRFETIFTQQDKEGQSIDMRKEILEDAWHIFSGSPLGVGVGAFPEVRMNTFGRSQPTHNLFLEVACDMGVQGLIVFLGLLISLVYTARRISLVLEGQIASLPAPPQTAGWTPQQIQALASHASDLKYMHAAARGVYGFLIIRIGLGLFGHDFYEIYWWFSAGLLLALNRMMVTASQRTALYIQTAPPASTDIKDHVLPLRGPVAAR